jgi:hypothetical protein
MEVEVPRRHRPRPPRGPLAQVQLDFKDATTGAPEPDGKRLHAVETLNFVDAGTSSPLMAEVSSDFHALDGV